MRDGALDLLRAAETAPPAEPWVQDFFEFLARALGCGRGSAVGSGSVAERSDLVFPNDMVVGQSPAIRQVFEQIRVSLDSSMNVLLTGETGTGKELFARLIHLSGPKATGPFVAINCAAIPADLLEAELFGVVKGTATGVEARDGRFIQAAGGTIFLDEISEVPPPLQVKMLRVLAEREVLKLGGTKPVKVDVRVISATNQDLRGLVEDGVFRPDLYYRLVGLEYRLPPLRGRRDDIPAFVTEFVSRATREYGKPIRGVSRSALAMLTGHDWPGNVRELRTVIDRAVLVASDGDVLSSHHFADLAPDDDVSVPPIFSLGPAAAGTGGQGTVDAEGVPGGTKTESVAEDGDGQKATEEVQQTLEERLDAVKREAILEALTATGGNKSAAARRLGVSRNGLSLMIQRLGIDA